MTTTTALPASVLTKSQFKTFRKELRNGDVITAKVRYDDQCGNKHNSFAITGELYDRDYMQGESFTTNEVGKKRYMGACGCLHDEIEKHFPELAPLLKWHLTSSDGPMHYVANTLYHVLEHGPNRAWVYYKGKSASDPLNLGNDGVKERLLGYLDADKAREAEGKEGYRVQWDEKTAKAANLDYARSSAVWPEATDEELTQDSEALKAVLLERLPALMDEFKAAVESLGFTY